MSHPAQVLFAMSGLSLAVASCGDPGASTERADSVLQAASWAVGHDPAAVPQQTLDVARADPEAALVIAPLDHLGIPWDAFDGPTDAPTAPPAPWVAAIDAAIATLAADGRPFALVVSPLSPDFGTLAAEAREANGRLIVDPSAFRPCFDPATETRPEELRDRFARYVAWLANRARPAHLVVGHRLNLYEAQCGDRPWRSVLGFVGEAIARVRGLAEVAQPPGVAPFVVPNLIVGLDVEDLHGLPRKPGRCAGVALADCLATRAPQLASSWAEVLTGASAPDVVGLESYPAAVLIDAPGEDIPATYLPGAIRAVTGWAAGSTVLGTGLPGVPLATRVGTPCVTFLTSGPEQQIRWLDLAITASKAAELPFLAWRHHTDAGPTAALGSCPCSGDAAFCDHLDDLGVRADPTRTSLVEGLIDSDGAPRPALTRWRLATE
jgi:hypothetical protein